MKGKKFFRGIGFAVLAVFSILTVVMPARCEIPFWVGFSTILFVVGTTLALSTYSFCEKSLENQLYGLPLVILTWNFLLAQTAIGAMFIFVSHVSLWILIALAITLCVCAVVAMLAVERGRNFAVAAPLEKTGKP